MIHRIQSENLAEINRVLELIQRSGSEQLLSVKSQLEAFVSKTASTHALTPDYGDAAQTALAQVTDILSDSIITAGSEKIKMQHEWSIAQSDYSSTIIQAKIVFNNSAGFGDVALEAVDTKLAYDALSAVSSYWADSTVDTDVSAIVNPSLTGLWTSWYIAIAELKTLIAHRLNPPRIYFFVNGLAAEIHPIDPIPSENTTPSTTGMSYAEFQSNYGVAPVVGKYGIVADWYDPEMYYPMPGGYGNGFTVVSLFEVIQYADMSYGLMAAYGFGSYSYYYKVGDSFGTESGAKVVLGYDTTSMVGSAGVYRVIAYELAQLAPPTSSKIGGVKAGSNISIASDGTISSTGSGTATDKFYEHDQGASASTWYVTHNLGKYPAVSVVNSVGSIVVGQITYTSLNTLTITFNAQFNGVAYCN